MFKVNIVQSVYKALISEVFKFIQMLLSNYGITESDLLKFAARQYGVFKMEVEGEQQFYLDNLFNVF